LKNTEYSKTRIAAFGMFVLLDVYLLQFFVFKYLRLGIPTINRDAEIFKSANSKNENAYLF